MNRVYYLAVAMVTVFGLIVGVASAQISDQEAPAEMRIGGQTVINGQINAFRSKRHDDAFSFADPNIRSVFGSTDRFIGMVKNGYGAIYGARQWSFGRSRFLNGDLFQEVLLTGPNGKEWMALYTLRQQPDGSWKITGVQMKEGVARTT